MDGYFDAIIVPMGESMSSGIPKNPDDPAPKRISRSKVEGLQTFCDQMTNHWVQPTPTPQAASFSDSNGYPMQSQYYYRGPVVEPPWLESRGPSHPFNSWMYQEPFIWTQDSPRPAWPDTPPPEDPFPPPFNPVSPSFFSDQTMMNPSPALETAAPNLDQRRTIDDYDNFDDFCGNPGVSTILGDDHGTLDAAGEILMDLPLPNVDDILGSGSSNSEKNSPSQSSDIGPDIPQSLWTPDYNLDTTAFDERFNLASGLSMFNNFSQEL